MQFCGEPGCGVLVPRGRCPTHAPRQRYTRAVYAETHAWYGTVAWQRLRMHVLRESPFCRVCLTHQRRTVATEVDHVVKHDGDRVRFWDVDNLQALCRACHQRKTNRGE